MRRFTISLDDRLAEQFDGWRAKRRYATRSEAVRDLLRGEVARALASGPKGGSCVASVSYLYRHRERDLALRLAQLQHQHHSLTMSTMRVPLDRERCMETVLMRGPTASVEAFASLLIAERGVQHGSINVISVELKAAQSVRRSKPRKAGAEPPHGRAKRLA